MPRDDEMLDNWWDEAYSGPMSFMRFKFSKDLANTEKSFLISFKLCISIF